MARIFFSFIVVLTSLTYCTSVVDQDKTTPKFIPDHTPYIAGLIEATHDTVHYFPEVVIGYFTDPLNSYNEEILNPDKAYPNLYNTTLIAQLTKTSRFFGLLFEPEINAMVTVQGPLNTEYERNTLYTHIGNGVYGDKEYQLKLLPGQQYRLMVTLPDERKYQAVTVIPNAVDVHIPDSIGIKVKYRPFDDGTPLEIDIQRFPILIKYPHQAILLEMQENSEHDRDFLLMEPEEEFRFNDYGPYLRLGTVYGIGLINSKIDTITNSWTQRLDKPKEEIWMKRREWYRLSFFSDGIGGNFFALPDLFSSNQYYLDTMNEHLFDAYDSRDTTYLFDISTIHKLDSDGRILPKDSSDAIGFFGGYFSVYRTTTVYPIRTFDLDSVLARHNKP